MTDTPTIRTLTRRQLLSQGVAAGAGLVVGSGFVAGSDAAWATEMNALKPDTMATLIQMARDIYPTTRSGTSITPPRSRATTCRTRSISSRAASRC